MKEYELEDIINFGKYNGSTIKEIVNASILYRNGNYLIWCSENIPNFKLSDTVKKYYRKKLGEKRENNYEENYYGKEKATSSSRSNYKGDYGAHSCPGDWMGMDPSDFGVPNC